MINKIFQQYRDDELLSKYSDFDFSEILKAASNNQFWQDKEALWTVISRRL